MSVPGVVGGNTAATAELTVETQDRVDDDGNLGSDENTDNDNVYATIQAAVDAAPDGAKISVTKGTYNETVVVDKPNLVIVGETGDPALAGAGNTAPVLDTNNTKRTAFKLTHEADNVVIKGFEIREYTVFGFFPSVGSTQTIEGVTISDNTISDVRYGVAFLNQNDDAVFEDMTVTQNDISNVVFGVNAIGTVGVSDLMDVTISENVITDASTDGIQFLAGDGIAEMRNLTIVDNTIDTAGNQGIELVIDGDGGDSSIRSVEIRSNTVRNTEIGIEMHSLSGGEISSVKVYHNELRNNRIGTSHNVGTTNDIVVRYNIYEGNTEFAIEHTGADLLQAQYNWYGARSGPTVSSNPGGTGDAVSANVSYDPFLTRVVNVENGSASVGNATLVDITADAGNVAGYEITLEFNESVVQVESVEGADFAAPTVNIDNQNGVVTFTQSKNTGVDRPTLARVKFNVTAPGKSNVTVRSSETALFDAEGDAISSVTYDRGVVANGTGGSGDVNGDGQVNAGDVVLLQQYLTGEDVSIDTQAADADGDGDVDAGDVLAIQQDLVSN